MSFAAGTFTLVAGNPVVTNTVVSSTWANTTLSDIASGLSTCILKDGTQVATATVPFALGITGTTFTASTSVVTPTISISATQNIASVGMWYQTVGPRLVFTPPPAGTGFQWNNAGNLAQIMALSDTGILTIPTIDSGSGSVVVKASGQTVLTGAPSGTATFPIGIAVGGATAGAGGIAFPAVAVAVSNANTLDDYEEGTWTPVLHCNGTTTGITYTSQAGTYTKVGKLVTYNFAVVLSNRGSSTGNAVVSGLPFANGFAQPVFTPITWANTTTAFVNANVDVVSGGTTLRLNRITAASTIFSTVSLADLADTSAFYGTVSFGV